MFLVAAFFQLLENNFDELAADTFQHQQSHAFGDTQHSVVVSPTR
jgi:hypothetical protein